MLLLSLQNEKKTCYGGPSPHYGGPEASSLCPLLSTVQLCQYVWCTCKDSAIEKLITHRKEMDHSYVTNYLWKVTLCDTINYII